MPMHSAMLQSSAYEYVFFVLNALLQQNHVFKVLTLVDERLQMEI